MFKNRYKAKGNPCILLNFGIYNKYININHIAHMLIGLPSLKMLP
jgi:hypothetical protein